MRINKSKSNRALPKGWVSGSTQDFLGLTDGEMAFIDLKLELSQGFKKLRLRKRLTQVAAAKLIGSSQSRVAKMETGDPSVSIDLSLRALFALGATKQDVALIVSSDRSNLVNMKGGRRLTGNVDNIKQSKNHNSDLQRNEDLAQVLTALLLESNMDINARIAGALIMALEIKDPYAASHSAGVALYCRDMARVFGMSSENQSIAHMAGLLHDIGRLGTPNTILEKTGQLTKDEFKLIEQQPKTASLLLSQLSIPEELANAIRHSQERYDGSGYPDGIKGEEIPELSRILAVADTYDALTAKRPYRAAKSKGEAIKILKKVSITQLDPKFVDILINVLDENADYSKTTNVDFYKELQTAPNVFFLRKVASG